MPRTIVPEEEQQAADINALQNNIRPTRNRTVQVESDASGEPNFFYWDESGDSANADGVSVIESSFTTFPDGTSLSGTWKRVNLPFSAATTDDLSEGSNNLYYSDARAKDTFTASGDITYTKSLLETYSLSNASFSGNFFDLASKTSGPGDLAFNSDGTKVFVADTNDNIIFEYDLSTGFDISTASYNGNSFDASTQLSSGAQAVTFNGDGTKMFVVSRNNTVYEYDLSTGFDVTTASYSGINFDTSSETNASTGIHFNGDGTKMFISSAGINGEVFEYDLSTGFDLSTASYNGVSFDTSSEDTDLEGVTFREDGTEMFTAGRENGEFIYKYNLSNSFDISSASYSDVKFDVSNEESIVSGVVFGLSGEKMFITGRRGEEINEYDTTSGTDKAEFSLDVSSLSASDLFGNKTTDSLPEGSSNLYFTDEKAQDAVGTIISGSGRTTVTYDDAVPAITVETSDEAIQDAVFNNTLSGDQTLITVSYDDANNEVDYEVESDLSQYSFTNVSTDDISEGSNNLYFTSSRVKDEFQAGGDITYNKNLGESYDLSVASFNQSFDVSGEFDQPSGIDFNSDGTKIFVAGSNANIGGNIIGEYDLSTAYDISTASYNGVTFDTSGEDTNPNDVTFNNDGTKMFVLGNSNKNVYEYDLSTAFDISTASYSGKSFDLSNQSTNVFGIVFNSEGTKVFIDSNDNANIYEYSLSTAFDLSSMSYTGKSFKVTSEDSFPLGIDFRDDGTEMFIVGNDNNSVYKYNLSTSFDLSTASYSGTSFDVGSEDSFPVGIKFDGDGNKLFISGRDNDNLYEYNTGSTQGAVEFALDVSSLSASDLFGSKTTDDLPEGSSSLYYTDERVQDTLFNALEGTGGVSITYDDAGDEITINASAAATDVSEDGGQVVANAEDINFGEGFSVTDDTDGTVTVSSDTRFGEATFSGDGIQKEFNIAHGLSAAPSQSMVQANSDEASGISHTTVDGTNITVVYDTAPPDDTNNIVIDYVARV